MLFGGLLYAQIWAALTSPNSDHGMPLICEDFAAYVKKHFFKHSWSVEIYHLCENSHLLPVKVFQWVFFFFSRQETKWSTVHNLNSIHTPVTDFIHCLPLLAAVIFSLSDFKHHIQLCTEFVWSDLKISTAPGLPGTPHWSMTVDATCLVAKTCVASLPRLAELADCR